MVEHSLEIQVDSDDSEQSFLEEQQKTPFVPIDSNLDELTGFKARVNKLEISKLIEAKNKLEKQEAEFTKDLKDCDYTKYWDYEVLRLLGLTQSKIKYVGELIEQNDA